MKKRFYFSILLITSITVFSCKKDETPEPTPMPPPAPMRGKVIALDGGNDHSLALCSDGTVWTWGRNNSGQLGNGTYQDTLIPVKILGMSNVNAISCEGFSSFVLKSDGTIWTFGSISNIPTQVEGLTNIISISSGDNHTLALKSDSTVWAWGANSAGQLGDSTFINSTIPIQVKGLKGIIQISAGDVYGNSFALKSDGTVWGWGWNQWTGNVGDSTFVNRNYPVRVKNLTNVKLIEAGGNYALALKTDGTVWVWGSNNWGCLGVGSISYSPVPIQVPGLNNINSLSGGNWSCYALKNDSTLWGWGADGNSNGDLSPKEQIQFSKVKYIGSGDYHSFAIQTNDSVWGWGSYNAYGEIGNGMANGGISITTPVKVLPLCQ